VDDQQQLVLTLQATPYPTLVTLEPMDWWLIAFTPFGLFSYMERNKQFVPGIIPASQKPVINDGKPLTFLDVKGLPLGKYYLFFGADLKTNGTIDESFGFQSLELTVVAHKN
jgi:hypothetical protein